MADEQLILGVKIDGITDFKTLTELYKEYEILVGKAANAVREANALEEDADSTLGKKAATLRLIGQELKPLITQEKELTAAKREANRVRKEEIVHMENRARMMNAERKRMGDGLGKDLMHQGQGFSNLLGKFPKLQGFFAGTTKEARMFSDTMGLLAGNILRLGVTMGAFVIAGRFLQKVIGGLDRVLEGVIQSSAEMERHTIRFTALLQDEAAAIERVGFLAEYSFSTPFELQNVVDAGATLEGFGLGAERHLKRASDMAAAFGVSIEDAALALGKLKLGQFERLEKFGLSRAMLAQEAGLDYSLIRINTPETLALMWDEALKIIDRKTKGAADSLAESFEGIQSNIRGTWQEINLIIGEAGAFDSRKKLAERQLDIARKIRHEYEILGKLEPGKDIIEGAFDIEGRIKNIPAQAHLGAVKTVSFKAYYDEIIGTAMVRNLTHNFPTSMMFDQEIRDKANAAYEAALRARDRAERIIAWKPGDDQYRDFITESFGGGEISWERLLAQFGPGDIEPREYAWSDMDKQREASEDRLAMLSDKRGAAAFKLLVQAQAEVKEKEKLLKIEAGVLDVETKRSALAKAMESLRKGQETELVNLKAENQFLKEGDPLIRQKILLIGMENKALAERNDLLDRFALLNSGKATADDLGLETDWRKGYGDAFAMGGGDPHADPEAMQWKSKSELWREHWDEMTDINEIGLDVMSSGVDNAAQMMGDAWELMFSRQIGAGQAALFAADAIGRGMLAMGLEFISELAKAEAKKHFAYGLGLTAFSFMGTPGATMSAKSHFAAAAAFGLLAGVTAGAAGAVAEGAMANKYQPNESGATSTDSAGKAKSRNTLSMRGAATYNIYMTYHLEIHGNVITSDQEWTDSQMANYRDSMERGLAVAAA